MAFYRELNGGSSFKDDENLFIELYDMSIEEFIKKCEIDVHIDLKNKIVVTIDGFFIKKQKLPMYILDLFIDEGKRLNYSSELFYCGQIAFLKIIWKNGKIKYFYKDDECFPYTLKEYNHEQPHDTHYCWVEECNGCADDISKQIEYMVKGLYDFNFTINEDDVIILEGL